MATFMSFIISFGCGYVIAKSCQNLYWIIKEKMYPRSNTYIYVEAKLPTNKD